MRRGGIKGMMRELNRHTITELCLIGTKLLRQQKTEEDEEKHKPNINLNKDVAHR